MYPTLSEYLASIKDSTENFDKLTHLKPVLDNHGDPSRSVGGFAVVFKMQDEDTGKLYAIKCFHEEQSERAESYMEIGKALQSNKSPYVMDVNYLPNELFVDSKLTDETEFPVLQMDWIDGETMETYIASHFRDTDAIRQLYFKFCDLALWLRTKPFAHGDIKPDNIMIKPDGNLTLVDYDGMFVPSLSGKLSPTIGTKSFAHPQRTAQHFDEHIDDFALASICISLLAMSEDASLYKDFAAPDRLLFSYSDYLDFENSDINKRLHSMGGLFPKLLELFSDCLSTYDGNEGVYDQIFDLQTKAPEIVLFKNDTGESVYVEDNVSLRWEVSNATRLTINGHDVTDEQIFRDRIKNLKNVEYKLVASNGLKESSSTIIIIALPKPKIIFRANKLRLRRGKEKNVRFHWEIHNAHSATFSIQNKEEKIPFQGEKNVEFDSHSIVKLSVIGLDGSKTFSKTLNVNVFSESETLFSSDKLYTLPGVPVKIKWNVKHAKEVELLNIGKVDPCGYKIIEPRETTTFILKTTDAFGTREYPLKIQMLPIPSISLQIPMPQFVSNTNIVVNTASPPKMPSIPDINIMGVELNVPTIPDLEDLNIKVELSEKTQKQINLWGDIKSLYSIYKSKLQNYIQNER